MKNPHRKLHWNWFILVSPPTHDSRFHWLQQRWPRPFHIKFATNSWVTVFCLCICIVIWRELLRRLVYNWIAIERCCSKNYKDSGFSSVEARVPGARFFMESAFHLERAFARTNGKEKERLIPRWRRYITTRPWRIVLLKVSYYAISSARKFARLCQNSQIMLLSFEIMLTKWHRLCTYGRAITTPNYVFQLSLNRS